MKLRLSIALALAIAIPSTSGYVTSGLPGHKHRAWLKKMTVDICQLPAGDLTPEMCSTTPELLSAWAQNPYVRHSQQPSECEVFPHHGKECALACEQLLKRLVDERRAGNVNAVANTDTYNALIDVWARSGERGAAAQRAEQIVIGMQDAYAAGEKLVQPNLKSFSAVMLAWSKAGNGEKYAPNRSQQVLEWMVKLYESGANDLARPDTDCFNIVLQAWARSNHEAAPQKTEQLLMWMDRLYLAGNESAKPTTLSFNHVLTSWSKSKQPGAPQRAEDILNHMERLSATKGTGHLDLEPNLVSYSSVVAAWAKSRQDDAGQRADDILQRLERKYSAGNGPSPDTYMYNFVIDAYAKSNSNKACIKARSVLDRQITIFEGGVRQCKPDVYSFTSVLGSCASLAGSRRDKLNAFEMALSTYEEMCKSGIAPNHVTYGTMLKACGRLLPVGKRRRRLVKEFFTKCCQDGCLGDMALSRLEEATSPEEYKELMKGESKKQLPPEWTWQVPDHDRKLRRVANKKSTLLP